MSNAPPKTPGKAEQPKRQRSPKLQSPDADPDRNPQDATRKGHCADQNRSARSGMAGGIVPPPDFREAGRSQSATVEETMAEAEALATLTLTNTSVAPDALVSPDQFDGDPPTALWVGESTDCQAVFPKNCEVAYRDIFGEGKAYRLAGEGVCLKLALCQDRQCVALVVDTPPVAVLRYEPPDADLDDGTLAASVLRSYLAGLANDKSRTRAIRGILAACHKEGDVKEKKKPTADERAQYITVRRGRWDELMRTLTLHTLRTKIPNRFKEGPLNKYGSPSGVELAWKPGPTAWPIGTIDGVNVAGPPVVTHIRFGSQTDAGKDDKFPIPQESISRMLKGKRTNESNTIAVRYVGRPDRYDAGSRRLGVDAGHVVSVHIAHGNYSRASKQEIEDRKEKADEKRAEAWKETLAATAAHKARVAAAVAKEHRITSPTVARAATVTPPFSDKQLKTWGGDMWAAVE